MSAKKFINDPAFLVEWAKKEVQGYRYGADALENVHFGWEIARAALLADAPDVEGIVARFLNWPLPDSVCSDDCASIVGYQGRSGTNILTAEEAKQMLDHVVGPALLSLSAKVKALEEENANLKGHAEAVDFYEREFYPLSNFSAFNLVWEGITFATSEAAYHWGKFPGHPGLRDAIKLASSAHAAFKIAEGAKDYRRQDWDSEKVNTMERILRAKAEQHEYVRRKLLQTGDRKLVEGSWRDSFWGIGPNGDGKNVLGELWMKIRADLRRDYPEEGT